AAPRHVGVVTILAALARLALDAGVVRIRAQTLARLTLRRGALALARQQALTLAEVLLVGPSTAAAAPVAARAVVLPPSAQVLAAAPLLVHRAHLVERLFHRLERLVGLPALQRVEPLGGVVAPAAAFTSETLHLLEQFLQLLRRDLIRSEPALERLGLAKHHLVLALGEVRLEIGQTVHLLQQLQPLVALLEKAVEVRALVAERGVLEDRRQIAARGRRSGAAPLIEVPLLERLPLQRILGHLSPILVH